MDNSDFIAFQTLLFEACIKESVVKNKEYARNGDVLAQFKRIAEKKHTTPEHVASIFLEKHLDAIDYYILNNPETTSEKFKGRIIDAINYLCFIYALTEESE